MILLLALLHAWIDASCSSSLYSAAGSLKAGDIALWFLFYNLLAFSTQAVIGGIADEIFHRRKLRLEKDLNRGRRNPLEYLIFALTGVILTALGAAVPLPLPAVITLIGLGNSIFHVGAGGYVLSISGKNASGIGLFVGPGGLGLTLGILFPQVRWVFVTGLVLTGLAVGFAVCAKRFWAPEILFASGRKESHEEDSVQLHPKGLLQDLMRPRTAVAASMLLCAAVAFRAFGGSFPVYSWKIGAAEVLLAAVLVMAGKIAGGFAFDRFGARKTMILSACLATPMIAFLPGNEAASLLGIFALNMAMPVTLILLYRCLPRYPAFAFGLAASILFPGSLIGQLAGAGLQKQSSQVPVIIFIICSIMALLFVLISYMLISRKEKKAEVLL